MVKFSYKGQPEQFSTSISISVSDWNKKKKQLRQSKDSLFAVEINKTLSENKNKTERALIQAKALNKSFAQVSDEIKEIFGIKEKRKRNLNLPEFVGRIIEERRGELSQQRLKNYGTLQTHLCAFFANRKINAAPADVDLKFLNAFKKYFVKKGSKSGTIETNFNIFFAAMQYGLENGMHSNGGYRPKSFKVTATANKTADRKKFIYLWEKEKKRLIDFNFGERYGLMRSADRLLIECETGLRYSDMNDLSGVNVTEINGKLHLQTATMKTAGNYSEPMSDLLTLIYRKYGNGFPPLISNQKFNKHLKIIGQEIGMNEYEHFIEVSGGEKKRVGKQRWQLLTSHTGRRDFATQQYMKGVALEVISLKMSHSSTKQTLRYIHPDALAVRMRGQD